MVATVGRASSASRWGKFSFRLTRGLVDVHVVRGRLGREDGAAHVARREEPCDAVGSDYGMRRRKRS